MKKQHPLSDLDADIRDHIERETQDSIERGMTPEEARYAALRKFGNVTLALEETRSVWIPVWLDQLRQDVRSALRSIRRSPTFAVTAVLTLAVGLSLTIAIFAIANWTLLRPIPGVTDPDNVSIVGVGTWMANGSLRVTGVSYPNYRDIATRVKAAAIGGYTPADPLIIMREGHGPRQMSGQFVTASFFEVLGVRMAAGRPFTSQEDIPGAVTPVVVISERLWASAFNRDPAVLGQSLRINGHPFTIIGVTGGGFRGLVRVAQHDVWLPGAAYSVVNHHKFTFAERNRGFLYQFVVRLSPGASWQQVESELQSFGPWLAGQYPKENELFNTSGFHLVGRLGASFFSGRQRLVTLTGVMMGISALVLLIACANVAGLLMTRGIGRAHEVALRKVLGGGNWRQLQQHLIEGVVLWLAAGGVAILLVWAASRLVAGAPIPWLRILEADIALDWRVIAFSTGVTLSCGLLFSILPALRTLRAEPADTLRNTSPTITRPTFATGIVLAVFQLSTSLTLLVGAMLFVATLRHLAAVDLGFVPSNVWAFEVAPGSVGYSEERASAYYQEFSNRLSQNASVASIAMARSGPLFMATRLTTRLRRYGDFTDQSLHAPYEHLVLSPGYFETLGIRVVRGRDFSQTDMGSPERAAAPVVVLSESLARSLFGTTDVIGEPVEFPTLARRDQRHEVIGVVEDVHQFDVAEDPPQLVYDLRGAKEPFPTSAMILVRTRTPLDMTAEVRAVAASLNTSLPIAEVIPLTIAVKNARGEWDVLAKLIGFVAAVATFLTACGLYGVVAFGVAARQREFGVRMALGATAGEIRRLALRPAAMIVGAGILLGLVGAAALTRILENRLFGVGPFDSVSWVLAVIVLASVAFFAALLPARHATTVDVADTLRST
jgi:predicted permease